MMEQRNKILIYLVAALTAVSASCPAKGCCSTSDSTDKSKAQSHDAESASCTTKPMIIWFHSGASNYIESLKLALSSGLITHVILLYMHRADADWKENPEVRQAINMVKNSEAKLIWCRNLWPYYANDEIRLSDFFDPNYYVEEVKALRTEAKEIGTDLVALDTEPYGLTPMKKYLKSGHKLTPQQFKHLMASVKKAIEAVGQVDFVLPAGSARPRHPYYVLANLGRFKISEYTYYDKKRKRKIVKRPNEIFGAYVNTTRKRTNHPESPYFLVSDIFERSQLWSDRKGLFLFTDSKNAVAVAKELVTYANKLPRKDPFGKKDPNSP